MTRYILISVLALGTLLFSSCERYYNPGLNIKTVVEDTIDAKEIDILIRYLPNAGDFMNSKKVPALVSVEDVNDNLAKYHLIDIRTYEEYVKGHISGAVNVSMPDVIDYLEENIAASTYDKIVIVCKTGQSASYTSSVLRLIGFSNAYAMKYGMSAWNRKLDLWSKNVSNKYANSLETVDNAKGDVNAYPEIKTGNHCGAEILEARARTVLNTPFEPLKIDADRAFSDTSFYIVNYWPNDKYRKGHIPGATQYTPKADLNGSTFLNTLPSDKKILLYCYTGQHSAAVVAYLRILGYNAFSLGFGANSFMHSTMVSTPKMHGFVAADKLHDYPLVEGENPTDEKFEEEYNNASQGGAATPKAAPVKRKKQEVEGGCG